MAEKVWEYTWFENQRMFSVITELLEESGVDIADIDVFVPGLGPGSFAGTRIALSAARGMALPGIRMVFGVSSGEALALAACISEEAGVVAVVGDARKQQLWAGVYEAAGADVVARSEWTLCDHSELAGFLDGVDVIVTSEWDRLVETLQSSSPDGSSLIAESRYPSAATLGRLASNRIASGIQAPELSPIYLHPPVFVEPMYK
jgi:tRNA threonylcarbamoyl adenosine modification protein YeaZ